ncbi:hypothetical protein GC102_13280 [Paenibacillus sp. LMG 31460]|uniref:Protein CR006 P-loop domain-containing protein n=1 Tax=Paenibacillus germinis TaxID=2654979 RepID=A0ABX1Z030_9BACL|nr:hypothetical protein [Paenibacillus germinis]NOU86740.1 hypothetical protein [Paenibacillus germinis]
MDRIKVLLMNCYGISKLESEFDFTNNNSTHIIYAPNGVMKTSFANVFDDYSKGIESRDLIYTNRVPSRKISNINDEEIDPQSIFVIRSYEKNFKSDKMATLLVNEELRRKYIEIHKKIDIEKEKLLKELKKMSGLKNDIDEEISDAFLGEKKNFLHALESIEKKVYDDENKAQLAHILYVRIFDEKVLAFLETGDVRNQIREYIDKYDELLKASTFLKKGFNHYNASTIHKNLKENGFFLAEHTLNLKLNGIKTEVTDEKELSKMILNEKDKILNDEGLKTIFEAIDKKITNAQLRDFRDYLFENKEILQELENLINFKRKLWITYLQNCKEQYQILLQEYKKGQIEIKAILEEAKSEKTEWEKVIEIFNRRFYVPYRLSMKNKEDTVLRDEAPSIHYTFGDANNVDEDLLVRILSQGEGRALYLLNIIFEIESRKKQGTSTLFIIDDIADSFDYKNKYAIIEYLNEISGVTNFFSIILTHNFDFFRTVQERIIGNNKYTSSYMASKNIEELFLEKVKYKYLSSPLKEWKKDLQNKAKLIASITFARNIAEYTGDNDNFNKLTSLLHMKQDTGKLTVKNLEDIFKDIFKDLNNLTLDNHYKRIIDIIFEVAENLCDTHTEQGLNLENKVVLSIAIRLNAEIYMIKKINDTQFVSSIKSSQTGKLFGRYKIDFQNDFNSIQILEKVNLMTPENIHLNSFMYEPILDISDHHLKQLYKELKQLITIEELLEPKVAVARSIQEEDDPK